MKWFEIEYKDGTWFYFLETSPLDIHFKTDTEATVVFPGGGTTDVYVEGGRQKFREQLKSNEKFITLPRRKNG